MKGDDAAAEKRWLTLSDEELDSEISAYRAGIRALIEEHKALGLTVNLAEDDEPRGRPRVAGVDVRPLTLCNTFSFLLL